MSQGALMPTLVYSVCHFIIIYALTRLTMEVWLVLAGVP